MIPIASNSPINLLTLEEMFLNTELNVIELVIDYFSRQQAFSYLLRLRKGGITKLISDSFKNLGGSAGVFGNQLLDIKNYYKVIYPDSWQRTTGYQRPTGY